MHVGVSVVVPRGGSKSLVLIQTWAPLDPCVTVAGHMERDSPLLEAWRDNERQHARFGGATVV